MSEATFTISDDLQDFAYTKIVIGQGNNHKKVIVPILHSNWKIRVLA